MILIKNGWCFRAIRRKSQNDQNEVWWGGDQPKFMADRGGRKRKWTLLYDNRIGDGWKKGLLVISLYWSDHVNSSIRHCRRRPLRASSSSHPGWTKSGFCHPRGWSSHWRKSLHSHHRRSYWKILDRCPIPLADVAGKEAASGMRSHLDFIGAAIDAPVGSGIRTDDVPSKLYREERDGFIV